jgi:hypothetical protein
MELLDMDLLSMPAAAVPHSHSSVPLHHTPPPAHQQQFNDFMPPAPPVPVAQSHATAAMGGGGNSISDVFAEMNMASHSLAGPADNGVRPLAINTAEFGKRWGQSPFEAKQSIHCNAANLEQLRLAMPPSLHHVESIQNTSEAIFAATVTAIGSVILVHVKLNPMRRAADIVVKSAAHEISVREMAQITHALSLIR